MQKSKGNREKDNCLGSKVIKYLTVNSVAENTYTSIHFQACLNHPCIFDFAGIANILLQIALWKTVEKRERLFI